MPPYLRLVLPSACWNASKMICCFSERDADAGVGHRERDHGAAPLEDVVLQVGRIGAGRSSGRTRP